MLVVDWWIVDLSNDFEPHWSESSKWHIRKWLRHMPDRWLQEEICPAFRCPFCLHAVLCSDWQLNANVKKTLWFSLISWKITIFPGKFLQKCWILPASYVSWITPHCIFFHSCWWTTLYFYPPLQSAWRSSDPPANRSLLHPLTNAYWPRARKLDCSNMRRYRHQSFRSTAEVAVTLDSATNFAKKKIPGIGATLLPLHVKKHHSYKV